MNARSSRRRAPWGAFFALLALAGCDCDDSRVVGWKPEGELALTVRGGVSCKGEPVQLKAVVYGGKAPYTFRWEPATGLDDPTSAAPISEARTAIEYTVTVADAQGLEQTAVTRVARGGLPAPKLVFRRGAALTCAGDEVELDASAARDLNGQPLKSFVWNLGDGTPREAATTGAFVPVDGQLVRLTATDESGCVATVEQPLRVRALPTVELAFASGTESVCDGESVELLATALDADGNVPATLSWDLDGDATTVESRAASSGPYRPAGAAARLTARDAHGCTTSVERDIEVKPLPSPVIRFAQGSAVVCDGARLLLDAGASVDAFGAAVAAYAWDIDGDWSTVESTESRAPELVASGTRDVRLRVTDARGCFADAAQSLEGRPPPRADIAFLQGRESGCAGSRVVLSARGSRDADGAAISSVEWDLDTDGSTDWRANDTPPFAPGTAQLVRLTVRDALGCIGTATQPLSTTALPVARITFAKGRENACAGDPISLSAATSKDANGDAPVAYEWDLESDGTLDEATAITSTFAPAGPRTARLVVRDARGCESSATQAISPSELPVANAGPDRSVASGGSVSLSGSASGGTPALAYAWTPAASLDDATIAQPRTTPGATTTYTLRVTDANGCASTDDVVVEVLPALAVNAGSDARVCTIGTRRSATLTGIATSGVGVLSYQWTASPACAGCIASPGSASTLVTPAVTTTFTITVTDENGTRASDSVTVVATDRLTIDAGLDRRVRLGEATQLGGASTAGFAYRWTCNRPVCGLSDPAAAAPIARPTGTTVYTVTASDGSGCIGTDSVLVATEAKVLAAMPSEGINPWPRDAPLWIAFDTDIDPASLQGNVYLLDPADGRHVYIRLEYDAANRMLVIYPLDSCGAGCTGDKPYWNNREYLLVLEGGPGGVSTAGALGQPLYNDVTLQFVASSSGDGNAPAIAHQRPASNATGVSRDTQVIVKFTEHVDPRTVSPSTIWIEGAPSTVEYDLRTKQAFLRPTASLAANRTYTVRVQGVVDARSSPTRINSLTTSWSFTTGSGFDTTRPGVVSVTPSNGSASHDVGANVQVRFDESLDPWTIGLVRLLDEATGTPFLADVLYDDQTLTATLAPRSFLEAGRAYRIEVSGVTDHARNEVLAFTSRFTTRLPRLFESFEGGTPGWSLDAPWGIEFQAAYEASFGLGDSPGADYGSGAWTNARTPRIDVTGLGTTSVSFWSRRTMSTGDSAVVEYSFDGSSWTPLATLTGCTGWRRLDYAVPTAGRSSLFLRFRVQSNATVQLDGWFLDELAVR